MSLCDVAELNGFLSDRELLKRFLAAFRDMPAKWRESFLTTGTWKLCQKKIARSQKAWGGTIAL